jgi:mRNA-degrading endonuclease toxin of MazEF toxin-antitoxin module
MSASGGPARGEIWFSKLPTDPPEKSPRPVVVVSPDARNSALRLNTVLVVPLSTTPKQNSWQVELSSGETGLKETSTARPDQITTALKQWLSSPRYPLRRISERRLREIARGVILALGYPDAP